MFGAALLFALMGALVKAGSRTMPPIQLAAARVVVTLFVGLVMMRHARVSPLGVDRRLLATRGILGAVALVCFYTSLSTLPLGDATAIQYTNPILSAVLGAWLLAEPVARRVLIGAALSIGGVIAIARPSFLFGGVSLPTAGVLAACAGSLLSAFVYVTVRKLRATDDPLVIVFWFPLMAVPFIVPAAVRVWVWPTSWTEWLILLGIGATTQSAQVLMTRGLHLLPVSRATAVSYVQVVFGFVIGAVEFREVPTAASMAGAALILAGMAISAGTGTGRAASG